jgi:hypothetical protein
MVWSPGFFAPPRRGTPRRPQGLPRRTGPGHGSWGGRRASPSSSGTRPGGCVWTHHAAPGGPGLLSRTRAGVCLGCLSEVSRPGTGPARAQAAGCRDTVWTRGMRPCWQAGHTAPSSPAATVEGWRSSATAASRLRECRVCPRRARHCTRCAWRTRFAKHPPCRIRWPPRGGTCSLSRRKPSTAASGRGRRRWPRWDSCERQVPGPSSKGSGAPGGRAQAGGERG